jgi:hypothetical protein
MPQSRNRPDVNKSDLLGWKRYLPDCPGGEVGAEDGSNDKVGAALPELVEVDGTS